MPGTRARFGGLAVLVLLAGGALLAAPPQQTPQAPQFVATADFVRVPVRAMGAAGNFIPDLNAADFEVFEDGVRQTITSFSRTIGGRVMADPGRPAAAAAVEGIVMPAAVAKPTEGRVFIIFIDDLHIQFPDTQRLKQNLA